MIPLSLPAVSDAEQPFIARLRSSATLDLGERDALLIDEDEVGGSYAAADGLFAIDGVPAVQLDGDVVLVQPGPGRIERLLRAGSRHNTLLVTERCDQLCVMCSQPPKKTHVDRFDYLEQACLLAEPHSLIGISGGEPTLYKKRLLSMVERVLTDRPDIQFHILTNAQHFDDDDIHLLRQPLYRRVSWGIPLYASDASMHDEIVGKRGAFLRLFESFGVLLASAARVELRTVLLTSNADELPALARFISAKLRFIEVWSLMQLENTGFAKGRWRDLRYNHGSRFEPVAEALDVMNLNGVAAQLFNFPRCSVPRPYRNFAVASISDWKRKYAPACVTCTERELCTGFFEWHPSDEAEAEVTPL